MNGSFEFYVNGFPYAVTKVTGLTSSPEGFIDVERSFKPGGDYFRKWLASGDERAAEARLYGSGVHPVCTWAFSATPRYHDYSVLGEDGNFTETLTLHCRDIRVNDQVNPMASRPEEPVAGKPDAGELPAQTVIRTVCDTGDHFVFEKDSVNTWLMAGADDNYTDNEIQDRIDGRETTVLYRPA